MKWLIYSHSFDDERIKSLESFHDQFSSLLQLMGSGLGQSSLLCPRRALCRPQRRNGVNKPFLPSGDHSVFEACKLSTTCHIMTHWTFLENPQLCCALLLRSRNLEVAVQSRFTWPTNYILGLVVQKIGWSLYFCMCKIEHTVQVLFALLLPMGFRIKYSK